MVMSAVAPYDAALTSAAAPTFPPMRKQKTTVLARRPILSLHRTGLPDSGACAERYGESDNFSYDGQLRPATDSATR